MVDNRRGSRGHVVGTQAGPMSISPKNAQGLSEYRKNQLSSQIEAGIIREGGTNYNASVLKKSGDTPPPSGAAFEGPRMNRGSWDTAYETVSSGGQTTARGGQAYMSRSSLGAIAHSESYLRRQAADAAYAMLHKEAGSIGSGFGSGSGSALGSGAVDRLAPEVYSPLFTMANLNLPRDRITVNAWLRNFFDLHPIVRNAITLHATYPISKLNLKCSDKKVLQFFEDMCESMNLMETLGMLSLEFWKCGEAFPYAVLDEKRGQWDRIIIHNPDYIHVKKAAVTSEPMISMKPDALLQRLVMSNNPADVQVRQQIPDEIINFVRTGKDIPLNNFHVSHLKMLSAPYDVRGTSVIVSVFKDLMLYDKLRECFQDDTEFLTESGFKKYHEIEESDKLATYNKNTNEVEFQHYTDRIEKEHYGDMYHFYGKKIDVSVTPSHRMWLSQSKSHGGYFDYDFVEAKDVKGGYFYKALSVANWKGQDIEEVDVLGIKIPINQYLELLGYLIAEGCIYYNEDKYQYSVSINQKINSSHLDKIKNSIEKFGNIMDMYVGERETINTKGFAKNKPSTMREWRVTRKALTKHFLDEIGAGAYNKKIPTWVKQLPSNRLSILLNAMRAGDGQTFKPDGKIRLLSTGYRYDTASKQLADDVQEVLFKCGFAPRLKYTKNGQGNPYYMISWSTAQNGRSPIIYGNKKEGAGGATFKKFHYDGKVVCFSVPNELLIVRRNGLISIQGNCKFAQADGLVNPITVVKLGGTTDGDYRATEEDLELFRQMLEEAQYDKDFKLITHAGVTIDRVGASGAIIDIAQDMELIIKNIYTGLLVPPSVVESDASSYSSASIGLEVLRQRYFNFRNLMATWLQNKIFAPIAELQNFYEYKDGTRRLIIPEVEWNQMNLYDLQDYIGNITGLLAQKQVSLQTVYKSLGLSYDDERVKLRQEMINEAISLKEQEAVSGMTLTELRSLDPEKEIMEPVDSQERPKAQPGGAPGGDMGMGDLGMPGGGGGLGGMPGGDLGGDLGGPAGGMGELAPPPTGELGGAPAGPAGPPTAPEGGLGPGV